MNREQMIAWLTLEGWKPIILADLGRRYIQLINDNQRRGLAFASERWRGANLYSYNDYDCEEVIGQVIEDIDWQKISDSFLIGASYALGVSYEP